MDENTEQNTGMPPTVSKDQLGLLVIFTVIPSKLN